MYDTFGHYNTIAAPKLKTIPYRICKMCNTFGHYNTTAAPKLKTIPYRICKMCDTFGPSNTTAAPKLKTIPYRICKMCDTYGPVKCVTHLPLQKQPVVSKSVLRHNNSTSPTRSYVTYVWPRQIRFVTSATGIMLVEYLSQRQLKTEGNFDAAMLLLSLQNLLRFCAYSFCLFVVLVFCLFVFCLLFFLFVCCLLYTSDAADER